MDPRRRAAIDLAVSTRTAARSARSSIWSSAARARALRAGIPGRRVARASFRRRWREPDGPSRSSTSASPSTTSRSCRTGTSSARSLRRQPRLPTSGRRSFRWSLQNAHWTLRATPTQDFVGRRRIAAARSPRWRSVRYWQRCLRCRPTCFRPPAPIAKDLKRTNERLVSDIARRYHVEQELRESESRTGLIINAVKDCAIYMLDSEGRVASWNPGAQALNGYTGAEIIGKHFSVLYPPDRKAPPERELAVAARRGWYEEECWHLRKDGSRYCGDDIISAIRDEPGNLRGFSVVTRDATMRLELREQTERARDFYFSLFSGFPNLVWRSDTSRRLRLSEPGMARIHRPQTGRRVRLGLARRRASGRSRALARNHQPKRFPRRRPSNTSSGCAAPTTTSDRSSATGVRTTT